MFFLIVKKETDVNIGLFERKFKEIALKKVKWQEKWSQAKEVHHKDVARLYLPSAWMKGRGPWKPFVVGVVQPHKGLCASLVHWSNWLSVKEEINVGINIFFLLFCSIEVEWIYICYPPINSIFDCHPLSTEIEHNYSLSTCEWERCRNISNL